MTHPLNAPRKPWSSAWLTCGAMALGACGGGSGLALGSGAETLRFAKPTGALQCDAPRVTAADRQKAQALLEAAGVRVQVLGCGGDGRARITLCGAESGELMVADVSAAAAGPVALAELTARMAALGFLPWATWPDARTQACPAG
jgi:hypothetical protein